MADPNRSESIVIKRIKKVEGGHHGGAWKVAYADFVTAMMAFFLLLWLLNVTTDEAKNKISSYFDPAHPKISDFRSGSGGLLGGLAISKVGAMQEATQPIVNPPPPQLSPKAKDAKTSNPQADQKRNEVKRGHDSDGGAGKSEQELTEERLREELRKKEEEKFKQAEETLRGIIAANPELSKFKNNIMIDQTTEGLRIQILDQEGVSMFPTGSAHMYDKTRQILTKVSEVINNLPNQISIRGHTDAYKYSNGSNYTNWELSSDRANASRRAMIEDGILEDRFSNVMGRAATEPFNKADPFDPSNRRMSIILLRQKITPEDLRKANENPATSTNIMSPENIEEYEDKYDTNYIPPTEFKPTPGAVEFP